MNNQPLPPSERLRRGAALLGKLWKIPEQRCAAGWSLDDCTCVPTKKFCQARNLWIELALMEPEGHDFEEAPCGLGIAMRASEWDSTGLTMKINHSEVGVISIGSPQECVTGMVDMGKMMDAPMVLASTLRVLRAFPKSKVEGLSDALASLPLAIALPVEANPDEAFE